MTATAPHAHRVTRAVAHARDDLSDVADASVWSMSAAETMTTLDEVQKAKAQLAELEARLLVHAQRIELPAETGATTTANWHSHRTRTTRPAAHRAMRLADGLEKREATRTALAEGRIHAEQAEVILDALTQLHADLDPELVTRAERHLIGQAGDFDALALKHLSCRLLEVVAPEVADAHEAELLVREERDAAKATSFTMWEDRHGRVHGRFTLDTLTGAMLKKHLMALAAPDTRPATARWGNANPPPNGSGRRSPK